MSGPDVWGPHGWKFIHYITLGYPDNPSAQTKKQYYEFFDNLKNVLPCSICSNHYKEHLKVFPLSDKVLSNKVKFIEWGINMHNMVNKVNRKRIFTFDEGFKEIINNNDDCQSIENFLNVNSNNYINIILITSVILFVILIFYKLK
jgi:hypothetical protein